MNGVSFQLVLILALILNVKELRFKPIYRIILILPWAVPNYITALIWKGMFHRQFGVINQIIAPMVYSAEGQVLESGYLRRADWDKGLADIRTVASHPEGAFFYTWLKGVGRKP